MWDTSPEESTDPDVIWTRNLLIWSRTRYHCATEPIILNAVVLTNITEKVAFCVHGSPTLQLCRLMPHDDNQLDNILFPAQGFLWYMFPTYQKFSARIRNGCISNAYMKTDGTERPYCPQFKEIVATLAAYYSYSHEVEWPSGLRRWFKAPVSSEAWVRIPSLPLQLIMHGLEELETLNKYSRNSTADKIG